MHIRICQCELKNRPDNNAQARINASQYGPVYLKVGFTEILDRNPYPA